LSRSESPRAAAATETALLAALALVAFAANSLLTRAALAPPIIDPIAFVALRLSAGALTLLALTRGRIRSSAEGGGSQWIGPLALLIYAIPFTLAYVRLGAATGALLLFGTVQVTMVTYARVRGEQLAPMAWIGMTLAIGSLYLLVSPVLRTGDTIGVLLMVLAGVAWGAYSIAGRGAADALRANAFAFVCAAPISLLWWATCARTTEPSLRGVLLALTSGALASGVGYAIWYRALRGLRTAQAATLQVSVPIIAAVGAVALLGEPLTTRLVLCGAAALLGIAMVLRSRR
jgi:drug/metabolite transporter (DMT)-like permease